ncbi:hypothetical protein C7A10_07625 [Pseudomonas fluorescens]|uniref:Uncharacterized protein n=1 Tax=Pseudomonas fluorescens TaxID=294 RepID=A0A2T0IEQ1_PSEFL|nr:hypothetical protein C7A10_07625 [Pseudomonas fluorescens]
MKSLTIRGALRFFASELAPTGGAPIGLAATLRNARVSIRLLFRKCLVFLAVTYVLNRRSYYLSF